jgi:crossover junction endodeoxyribonuclease RuvC
MIVGIDPGASGALAFFDYNEGALTIHDMPTMLVMRGKKEKKEISPQALASILRSPGIITATIEKVGAMPGQGVSSMWQFGRSVGMIEGTLAALTIPTSYVTPQQWRKSLNVREGKDGSRQRACELFPAYAHLFARVKDDGRAEAALIAYYGAMR